jgi:Homeodomain-like domain-containing protein
MHPWYVSVDQEELRRLYVDERLTTTEIAARLGCGPTTIRRRLDRFNIAARPRGTDPVRWLRRQEPGFETLDIWSPAIAYAVGLIATDGNLGRDGRHLAMTSKDTDLLETLRHCLKLRASITPTVSGRGLWYWHMQWSDRRFHEWLVSIGLTPAKSLTLGPLAIPDEYFADFFRGCIDGDGSIFSYIDRYHTAKNPRYVYQRLYVSLVSASPAFVRWLQERVEKLTGLRGAVGNRRTPDRRTMWHVRFAKHESMALLRWMYYARGVPALVRKRLAAEPFLPASLRGILEAGSNGGVSELADDSDSKSLARKGVGVQIPSPLPTTYIDGLV